MREMENRVKPREWFISAELTLPEDSPVMIVPESLDPKSGGEIRDIIPAS